MASTHTFDEKLGEVKRCPGRGGNPAHVAPLAAFGIDNSRADGLYKYCKECTHAAYMSTHPDAYCPPEPPPGFRNCPGKLTQPAHVAPISEFGNNKNGRDGLQTYCRGCKKLGDANSHQKHKEKRNKKAVEYQEKHKDKVAEYKHQWYLDNIKEIKEDSKDRRKNKRPQINMQQRRWTAVQCATNPIFKLIRNQRTRLGSALGGKRKSKKTLVLIGLTGAELMAYLEQFFKPGMTRENYGSLWQVDHIIPCAQFTDLSNPEQQRQCFHYTNLQPLTITENTTKRGRIESILVPWLTGGVKGIATYN
jgi:hypothetical protein